MIISHCGAQGHRGRHVMMSQLASVFSIDRQRVQVDAFMSKCLLYLHVKGGKIIPRPWGETYRSQTRNEALHFDFLYLGESFGNFQYLLALKDDASHFCELVACESPTSDVAVEANLQWHSRFGIPILWINDQGSHFTSNVMYTLCSKLKCDQPFLVAYCPWINVSIERLNRDILQVFRTMILEYKLDHREWMSLISVVQGNLNHTALPSLAYKSPLELFTGLYPPPPLATLSWSGEADVC
ncbi:Retrotransposon protein, Ty3-gypsy subclass [Phytophthora megakarya]|uniref:Retrotransposon protein, Ty3-gypsy subclass n=1 Tax=Phytophthora megakarya TaxID=4795 RepID=A0A225VS85_9STRA|nr:Retrotransposon protein, Ty3-gypsy subclass [Phytophthora megakarya]